MEYLYNFSLSGAVFHDYKRTYFIKLVSKGFRKLLIKQMGNISLFLFFILSFLYLSKDNWSIAMKNIVNPLLLAFLVAMVILIVLFIIMIGRTLEIDLENRKVLFKQFGKVIKSISIYEITEINKIDRQKKGNYFFPSILYIKDSKGKKITVAYYFRRKDYDFFIEYIKHTMDAYIYKY